MNATATCLSAILLLTTSLAAAQPAQPGSPRDAAPQQGADVAAPAREPLPQIDVVELLSRLADEMDREFVLDPRLRVMLPAAISGDDADYDTLLAVLRQNGFAAVETGDQILLVPDANLRIQPSRILQQDDRRVSDHEIVTRVIDLPVSGQSDEGRDIGVGTQLVPLLRPMMGQNAQLGSVNSGTKLVIVDRYDNVRRITAVIAEITR